MCPDVGAALAPSWSVCVSCGCIIRRPETLLPCPACGGSPFGLRPLDRRGEPLIVAVTETIIEYQ